MSFYKKFCVVLIVLIAAGSGIVFASEIRVTIDGAAVEFEGQTPLIDSGRTLVPVRGVFEALGFVVSWDEASRTATLVRADYVLAVTADSAVFAVNDAAFLLEVPAQIINGRMMLPIRALLERVGYSLDWDDATRTVLVSTGAQAIAADFASPVVSTLAGTGSHGYRDGLYAQFNLPAGIFGAGETLYVADTYNNTIRTVSADGYVQRLSGAVLRAGEDGFPRVGHRDGAVLAALYGRPTDIAVDSYGRIFIADSENNSIRVIMDEDVFTYAGGGTSGHADGNAESALFYRPFAIAFGPCGGLFAADTLNHVIRRIYGGYVTTVAGTPGTSGHRDGENALFNEPMGIAVCESGRIFVADTGNHLIRVIENGSVRTLAGRVVFPSQINWNEPSDFDEEPIGGFADGFNAMFDVPVGLALHGEVLLVADSANHAIRAVLPTGEVVTAAGTGYADHTDGIASVAEFSLPRGLFVQGNTLFVADTGNNLIRKIAFN